MSENIYKNINPSINRPPANNASQKNTGMDRRSFLTGGLAALGLASIGALDLDLMTPQKDTRSQDGTKSPAENTDLAQLREQLHASAAQEEILKIDQDVIGKTFREQIETQDHITLDKTTKKAIYEYWKQQYHAHSENYREGLIAGLARMQPWLTDIRKAFHDRGIPDELVYLAIAESHFDTDAVSRALAVGPYQITHDTARRFHLIVTADYDERRDPIKSAELCAQHLQYSYEKFGNDWSLALMDYNGGLTNKYYEHVIAQEEKIEPTYRCAHTVRDGETLSSLAQKYDTSVTLIANINRRKNASFDGSQIKPGQVIEIPNEKRTITIDNFNMWLESHINAVIQKTRSDVEHTIKSGETLEKIAALHDLSPQELALHNAMTSTNIKIGQKIMIPIKPQNKTRHLLKILSSYHENINYPEKFYAIRDVIANDPKAIQLTGTQESKTYHNEKIPQLSQQTLTDAVRKGETFDKVAGRLYKVFIKKYPSCKVNYATAYRMILKQSNVSHAGIIREGTILSLTAPVNTPPSLADMAKLRSIPLKNLHHMNPAIQNPSATLPSNITVHIPKKTKTA